MQKNNFIKLFYLSKSLSKMLKLICKNKACEYRLVKYFFNKIRKIRKKYFSKNVKT